MALLEGLMFNVKLAGFLDVDILPLKGLPEVVLLHNLDFGMVLALLVVLGSVLLQLQCLLGPTTLSIFSLSSSLGLNMVGFCRASFSLRVRASSTGLSFFPLYKVVLGAPLLLLLKVDGLGLVFDHNDVLVFEFGDPLVCQPLRLS